MTGPPETQVYFVRAATLGLIKIGKGQCARRRLEALQCGSPDRLELLGIMLCGEGGALERRLHRQFAASRMHGEWFQPSPDLVAFIAENASEPVSKRRLTMLERRLKNQKRRERRKAGGPVMQKPYDSLRRTA